MASVSSHTADTPRLKTSAGPAGGDLYQFWYDDPATVASAEAAGIAQGPPRPTSHRGKATRKRLVEEAETIFADVGYQEASIVRITEAADVAQGTFYRYFDSKQQIFEEVVVDLNYRVRRAMTTASVAARTRLDAERYGFAAFFQFTAEHPALYRVIRQAEFVSPKALHYHYERIIASYIPRLQEAMEDGEVGAMDPTVLAWALIAVGEMTGMRWVLWDGAKAMPPEIFDELMTVIGRMLQNRADVDTSSRLPTSETALEHSSVAGSQLPDANGRHDGMPSSHTRTDS
ncbi:MAG: TetR/AcrR family transcriptional regulator [Solirubrobacteraceae bacterium]